MEIASLGWRVEGFMTYFDFKIWLGTRGLSFQNRYWETASRQSKTKNEAALYKEEHGLSLSIG